MNHAWFDLLLLIWILSILSIIHSWLALVNKCIASWNVLSSKISVPKETKYITARAFNVIKIKNEAKAMTEHISCDCKCKFNSTTCNSKQKWNNKTWHCESKSHNKCKKNYSWNPSRCIFENSNYLKNIPETSVTGCDEVVIVMDIVLIKKTNTIATTKKNFYEHYFNKLS